MKRTIIGAFLITVPLIMGTPTGTFSLSYSVDRKPPIQAMTHRMSTNHPGYMGRAGTNGIITVYPEWPLTNRAYRTNNPGMAIFIVTPVPPLPRQ